MRIINPHKTDKADWTLYLIAFLLTFGESIADILGG
jgi:hypothetical protein